MRQLPMCAVLALALLMLPATPSSAQGFFDMLFGSPKPPTAQLPPGYGNPARLLPPSSPMQPWSVPSYRTSPVPTDDDDRTDTSGKGNVFRTMCVRMCDGYYWPVSFATVRSRFHRDANACRASCGEEAKLFYVESPNGQIDDAVDLTGRTYSRLPNAFRYRKSLASSCACRPEPWSDAEMTRHERYALAEQTARKSEPAQVIAGEPYGPPLPTALVTVGTEPDAAGAPAAKASATPREPRQPRPRAQIAQPAPPPRPRVMQASAQRPPSWSSPAQQQLRWPGD